MRFACLHHGDQYSEALWSAIPLNIIRALGGLGHEVVVINGLQPQVPVFSRIKTAVYKYLLHKTYALNRDPRVFRARAKDANRRLAELGAVDAVLITYLADAVYLETDHPVILIHDATWAQMLDYYPCYESKGMAGETIRGGLDLDKQALERCDHAVYSSRWAAESVVRDYGVPSAKVSVAPLGASIVNEPTREDLARYLSRRGQQPMKLLFLGKEWYRKGGDIAMRVGSAIEAMGVPVELHVAGCDPEGEQAPFVRRHGLLRKDVPSEAEELRGLSRVLRLLHPAHSGRSLWNCLCRSCGLRTPCPGRGDGRRQRCGARRMGLHATPGEFSRQVCGVGSQKLSRPKGI